MRIVTLTVLLFTAISTPVMARDLEGPARFCGYSPVIDLEPGERIVGLTGGMHSSTFRWEGEFGVMDVSGIGWASRPRGRMTRRAAGMIPARFAQARQDDRYVIAIWNGAQGAAYFRSDAPFTRGQIDAIDRVRLFQEGQDPEGCDLRTVFIFE